MKRCKVLLVLLCVGLSVSLLRVQAQEAKQAAAPEYRLQLLEVADTNPPEYLAYIDKQPGIAYKSLYAERLRLWVGKLPKGSIITYLPSCLGPHKFTAKELDDFEAFCKSKGVLFPRYYAG